MTNFKVGNGGGTGNGLGEGSKGDRSHRFWQRSLIAGFHGLMRDRSLSMLVGSVTEDIQSETQFYDIAAVARMVNDTIVSLR
jgi:hypothetical protein